MLYKGSCHCGRIEFEAEGEIEKLTECNCSICSKRSALHWFIPRERFRLLTAEGDTGAYLFGKHTITHRFCPTCGCVPYSEGIAPSGAIMVSVNARCLDGVDLSSIEIGHFDGRSL